MVISIGNFLNTPPHFAHMIFSHEYAKIPCVAKLQKIDVETAVELALGFLTVGTAN